ncbi:hypothetical protein BURPS668_A1429 [Burkholderia pseudomallei 668]|nr:hypothetical protein BURPS668_A1429 [Burkholderia pseudomallei 668]
MPRRTETNAARNGAARTCCPHHASRTTRVRERATFGIDMPSGTGVT